jgi:hypothetical protein
VALTDALPLDALLLEGRFYQNPGLVDPYCIQTDDGCSRQVAASLQPFLGQRVRFALHHLPLAPESGRWGGGCCLWQPAPCPAGHHERPGYLYNVTGEGILRRGPWRLEQFDGTPLLLDLAPMDGHVGRLACVSLVDAERMRDIVAASGLEAVGVQANELADLLGRLKGTGGR